MNLTTLALGLGLSALLQTPALAKQSLPQPLPRFKGVIGKDYRDSKPDCPKPVTAPTGAPNVVLIMLDHANC